MMLMFMQKHQENRPSSANVPHVLFLIHEEVLHSSLANQVQHFAFDMSSSASKFSCFSVPIVLQLESGPLINLDSCSFRLGIISIAIPSDTKV